MLLLGVMLFSEAPDLKPRSRVSQNEQWVTSCQTFSSDDKKIALEKLVKPLHQQDSYSTKPVTGSWVWFCRQDLGSKLQRDIEDSRLSPAPKLDRTQRVQ